MTVQLLLARLWATTVPPGSLGPVDQDPQDVREQACRIVTSNDKVCTPATTTPPTNGDGGSFDLSWLSTLLWLLLIVALVTMVIVVMRQFAFGGGRRRRAHGEEPELDLDEVELGVVAVDRSREPVDWRAEADRHRRDGRFRDALRCRYRALVGDLARRGLIDEIPGRTTGEERAQLRGVRPVASPPFDAAADLFDDAWYGNVPVDEPADDRFLALEREVLDTAVTERR